MPGTASSSACTTASPLLGTDEAEAAATAAAAASERLHWNQLELLIELVHSTNKVLVGEALMLLGSKLADHEAASLEKARAREYAVHLETMIKTKRRHKQLMAAAAAQKKIEQQRDADVRAQRIAAKAQLKAERARMHALPHNAPKLTSLHIPSGTRAYKRRRNEKRAKKLAIKVTALGLWGTSTAPAVPSERLVVARKSPFVVILICALATAAIVAVAVVALAAMCTLSSPRSTSSAHLGASASGLTLQV